ncbi:MAG TPA: FAD-dependent thymidylate synthase, partial [Ktedonobacteraceae bacterium]|nr:FAD-dependent thymidylate synthase [Ktedonobacteraceae bacterium]
MSAIDAQSLFDELNGSEEAGFAAIHSPASSSPGKVPYLRAPGVAILARPHLHAAGLNGFLAGFDPELHFGGYLDDPTFLPDGAQLCKIAGQLCYMSFGPKRSLNAQAKRYFDNLKSSGHGSVFEHANFSLLLYGISRSVTHELIRHRAGFGFSQLSQRFVSGR